MVLENVVTPSGMGQVDERAAFANDDAGNGNEVERTVGGGGGRVNINRSAGGDLGAFGPGLRKIGGDSEDGYTAGGHACVERLGIGRVNGEGGDGIGGAVESDELLVAVVGGHLDGFDIGGVGVDEIPGIAGVGAAVEADALTVNHVGVDGVEEEERDAVAEVYHAPGDAAVFGDVAAGHVAMRHDDVVIVGADDGVVLGTAAAGAEDDPFVEARRGCGGCGGLVSGKCGRRGAGEDERDRLTR